MYKKILAILLSICVSMLLINPTTVQGLGDNPPNVPTAPAFESVTVSNTSHTAGSMQSVTITVTTKNVPNATTITAQLTDSAGTTPVSGVDTTSSTINNNTAAISLSIPAGTAAGNYRIKVNIASLNISDASTGYTIIAGTQASITTVEAEPSSHTSGNAQTVNVKVTTNNASNGTAVSVQLLDAGDGTVANVNAGNGTINNNYAAVSLSIPGNISAGSYKIRATVLTTNYDVPYTINAQTNNPTISRVRLSSYSQANGTDGIINVTVDTANVTNNALVTVDLVQAANTSNVVAEVTATGNINNNTATIPLTVPASVGAGSYKIRVTVVGVQNPDTTQNYSVVIPEMSIANISTAGATLAQGSISGNITITGSNFNPAAAANAVQIVDSNGVLVKNTGQPSSANSTSLTVAIPNDLLQGTYKVKVTVDSQSKVSTKTFTITAPLPVITGVISEGANLVEGSISGSLTVNGNNFGATTTDNILALVKGSTETICVVSSSTTTQLKATLPVNLTEGTYTVKVSVGGASATYAGFSVTKPEIPAAPGSITMGTVTSNTATINWSSAARATGYHVYRSVNNVDYTKITSSPINAISYNDSSLIAGTTYYYKVTAVNVSGESSKSSASSVITVPGTPAAPTTGTITSNSISLSWTSTTGAVGYNVYKSTNGADYSKINGVGIVDTTAYTDSSVTSGTTYYYKITAVNTSGESNKSSAVNAITLSEIPQVPSVGTITFNSIGISWTSVPRAQGYCIYRSTSLTGTFTLIGTTSADVLTYNNTGLSQGTAYYYKITAKNSSGVESDYSPVLNAATKTEAGVPNAPTANNITKTSLQINWASVADTNGYNIYRSTNGTTYTKINSTSPVTAISYSDSGLSAGTTYYYKLTSINADGESLKSPELTVVTISNEPGKPTSGTITSNSVVINWSSVVSATRYNIYRSTTQSSGYVKLNTTPIVGTSYTDSTVSASTKYYYKVTAVNNSGESDKSQELEITTTAPEIINYPVPTGPIVNEDTEASKPSTPDKDKMDSKEPEPVIEGSRVTIELTTDSLKEKFDKSQEDKNGIKTAFYELAEVDGAKEYAMQLPTGLFDNSSLSQKIEISTPIATIAVPDNMFSNIEDTAASKIELSIATVDTSKLSSKIKNAIGNRPILEFSALVDGKAIEWNNPDAPVTISIDYEATAAELKNPEHIVVSYIDGKGNLITVSNGKYNAATKKVTFTTTHFSKYAINYVFKTFKDISKLSAKKSIEVMYSKGIITGTKKDTFSPKQNITRGDFILYLVNTLGLTAEVGSNYADVKTTDAYYNAIGIAKKLGITSSVGKNKFNPDKPITKEEAAVILVKAMKVAKFTVSKADQKYIKKYSDYKKIASNARNSISILIKEGIYVEKGKALNPKNLLTREQIAVILYRLYNKN